MSSGDRCFRAGLVQMCSGIDPSDNVAVASGLIRQAAAQGAHYVQTPEMTNGIDLNRARFMTVIEPKQNNSTIARFADLARELKIWLHLGSIAVLAGNGRRANHAVLLDPDGDVRATYDKMHMFDVDLPNGESYRESAAYEPGQRAALADLPWGRLGLSICYDMRFPALYRRLAQAGADFLTAPSAFTRPTGQAHWQILLQARAIETGCYMMAAAQTGDHAGGRSTYGHSLIVAPWGEIIAQAGTEPGVIVAAIDQNQVQQARQRIPSLTHDREFYSAATDDNVASRTVSSLQEAS